VTDVGFDLEQVVRVAVEDTGVEAHHLHQSNRASAADGLWFQASIFGEQNPRQQAGWQL
jgi:hypothetical protein